MEINHYISTGLSALGLFGGLFSYIFGLRIKHDLLVNNEKLLQETRDCLTLVMSQLRNDLERDLEKIDEKHSRTSNELHDLQSGFTDRILNAVNGKYVRTDIHLQAVVNIQDRFTSMKELIEVNMDKIEQGLDRQILDLKDRIFHNK